MIDKITGQTIEERISQLIDAGWARNTIRSYLQLPQQEFYMLVRKVLDGEVE